MPHPVIELDHQDTGYIGYTALSALIVHGIFLALLPWITVHAVKAPLLKSVSVTFLPPPTQVEDIAPPAESEPANTPIAEPEVKHESSQEPVPKPKPEPVPKPEPEPIPAPVTTPTPQTAVTIIQSDETTTIPGDGAPSKPHIPSRWALKPPLEEKRLESLGFTPNDIKCLTSLEPECQELRKEVFAEYQLTETELVWTPNRPDTGMTAEFRGLTDNQILEKLGMNYAGGNAFTILPGITIDGPLWDKMHGVNKTCRLVKSTGEMGVIRVCD